MRTRDDRRIAGRLGVLATAAALTIPAALAFAMAGPTASATSCVSGAQVEGFNVSSFDGTINWPQAVCEDFVYARALDGTTADTTFAVNESGATSAGIAFGAYDLFEAGQNAATQASDFLADYTPRPGDLPPALDVETADGQTSTQLVADIATWVNAVERASGVRPVILTSNTFWTSSAANSTAFTGDPLWVIDWTHQIPTVPALNWGGNSWTFWFSSDTGTIPGDSRTGETDLDEFVGDDLSAVEIPFTTSVSVTSHTAKPVAGQPVKIGVEVTGHTGFTAPSGKVVVRAAAGHTCVATLKAAGSNGTGSCTLAGLAARSYDLATSYAGDSTWNPSTAAHPTTLKVSKAATKLSLTLSHKSVMRGHENAERFSVRVKPKYAVITPTGRVTVSEGGKKLCTVALKHGKGTCSPTKRKLRAGGYKVKASYAGGASLRPSVSSKRTLTVRR